MTTDHRDQQAEQELEQELEKLRSMLSGPEAMEPPDLLDQAVLNTARREIEQRGARRGKRGPLRWLGAFTTAAVIVLALSIVIQQEQPIPLPAANEADGLKLDSDKAADLVVEKRADAFRARTQSSPAPALEDVMTEEPAALKEEQEEEALPDPESWILRLMQLKESGQEDRLAEELEAFQKAFPDYPLPPELDY